MDDEIFYGESEAHYGKVEIRVIDGKDVIQTAKQAAIDFKDINASLVVVITGDKKESEIEIPVLMNKKEVYYSGEEYVRGCLLNPDVKTARKTLETDATVYYREPSTNKKPISSGVIDRNMVGYSNITVKVGPEDVAVRAVEQATHDFDERASDVVIETRGLRFAIAKYGEPIYYPYGVVESCLKDPNKEEMQKRLDIIADIDMPSLEEESSSYDGIIHKF